MNKKCESIIKGILVVTMAGSLGILGVLPKAIAAGNTDYSHLNTSAQMVSSAQSVPLTTIDGKSRFQSLINGWKFNLGDISGAQSTDYNDATWRTVYFPHDYSTEQHFS